jgi:hypothetical protein
MFRAEGGGGVQVCAVIGLGVATPGQSVVIVQVLA